MNAWFCHAHLAAVASRVVSRHRVCPVALAAWRNSYERDISVARIHLSIHASPLDHLFLRRPSNAPSLILPTNWSAFPANLPSFSSMNDSVSLSTQSAPLRSTDQRHATWVSSSRYAGYWLGPIANKSSFVSTPVYSRHHGPPVWPEGIKTIPSPATPPSSGHHAQIALSGCAIAVEHAIPFNIHAAEFANTWPGPTFRPLSLSNSRLAAPPHLGGQSDPLTALPNHQRV